jgi:hypothetical protein
MNGATGAPSGNGIPTAPLPFGPALQRGKSSQSTRSTANERISDDAAAAVFRCLFFDEANRVCFDCGNGETQWASVSFGVFICSNCSGKHRHLGTHITRIRSMELDHWAQLHSKMMIAGGNVRAHAYFDQYGLDKDISVKYRSQAATHYRLALRAQAEETDFEQTPPSVSEGAEPDASLYTSVNTYASSHANSSLLGNTPVKRRRKKCNCVVQ